MLSLQTTFQAAIDQLPDAIILVDQNIKIVAVNEQIENVFGYKPTQLLNQPLNILIPERFHAMHDMQFRSYFKQPVKRRMGASHDLFGVRKDGTEIDVDIALAPIVLENTTYAMATIRDISSLKELDRQLLKKNEELSLANTQLERLGYVIAHDLKSPLLNIHALISLLNRELGDHSNPKVKNYTQVLDQTAHSMMDLITGVTDYSKVAFQDVAEEEVDLSQVVAEVRRLAHCPAGFQLNVSEHLPKIMANKTKILQVFLNLVNNAVKYNDKPVGQIAIQAQANENVCLVSVCDNGPGIPEKLRHKVFELFHSGEPGKNGSQGIGLAVVKKIIEDHGGTIAIKDSPLGGANFIFTWPLHKPAQTGANQASA